MASEGVSASSMRTKVSTGYGRLDDVLQGGFLAGSAIVLNAPASDEVPILLRRFLEADPASLLISRSLSSAEPILGSNPDGLKCLVCSDKPVPPTQNTLPGKGIENLTELNLTIMETINSLKPNRLVVQFLSDVLLRHKALQTRKWLSELLDKFRAKNITTLVLLNPFMHSSEEVQAIVDLFNGNIELIEKPRVEGQLRKALVIKWMHGIEIAEKEFPLAGSALERQEATGAGLDKRRIAVLPFANLSSNPEDGYFADGLTEELIDRLCQVREIEVIARTSVMSYKKKEKKVSEIARELSVGSLIEGSVRKAGNRIRVTAQLINGATEGHLWSSHYDKNLDDIFAVQSEIAEKVAVALKTQLLESEKKNLERKPTENTEAYSNFLRGRELFREETESSFRQAIGFFEKAIELDPRFARAYVGVADCHLYFAETGLDPQGVSLSSAKTSLERAITLDPDLPDAHASLSALFFDLDDMPGAEAEARRALDLNPSLPDPHQQLAEIAGLKGDPGEMVKQIEDAYHLDPIRPRFIWLLGVTYLYTGREQEALEFWKKTEQLAPAGTYRGLMEYYISKGDLEKASEFYAKAEKLEPTRPWLIWMGGVIAALKGEREKALFAIKKIEDAKMGPIAFNFIAYVNHALDDLDSYFANMNKALEIHAIVPLVLMHSPLFAKARTDPRYPELLVKLRKQLGLTK